MQNFANQCLDMARAILSHNLDAIEPNGYIQPVDGDASLSDEPAHAAFALGEYYRATQETKLGKFDLLELVSSTLKAQIFAPEEDVNGIAYAALALLSFGPSTDRNPIWEKLDLATREALEKRLMQDSRFDSRFRHEQAFEVAKAVARFSIGFSKKDETSTLIDQFLEGIQKTSAGNFCDDQPTGLGGVFDLYGILSFVFIRQALQLHSNVQVKERKLPSLRTFGEKYIKILPDLVRSDGLGWAFGRGTGAYGQMHCITIILQSLRDGWILDSQKPIYFDLLRRLFQYFFITYLDQEHGYLVIRDDERTTMDRHSTRLASFDAARYLSQWARLAKSIGQPIESHPPKPKTMGRFIQFDKSSRKEQGLFIYQHAASGLHLQLPLVGSAIHNSCDSLAFPHAPGIFDWPVGEYLPILLPELTIQGHTIIPSYYGVRCTTGLGLKNAFFFRYDQPELITQDQKIIPGLGSAKVSWTFQDDKIIGDFSFTVKNQVQLDRFRFMMALAAPHSTYRIGSGPTLGEESLRATVERDDFQATWKDIEIVSDNPRYKTYCGKIHYLQTLSREHPLVMVPGQAYRLVISFKPHLVAIDEA